MPTSLSQPDDNGSESLEVSSLAVPELAQAEISPERVPAIVRGIITHYVDPEMRARLKGPADHLRLVEDLGLDSLTLMEIMMKVEDILRVTASDQELRHFRTLGDVRQFVVRAVGEPTLPDSNPLPA